MFPQWKLDLKPVFTNGKVISSTDVRHVLFNQIIWGPDVIDYTEMILMILLRQSKRV